jgi:hypothetical protein
MDFRNVRLPFVPEQLGMEVVTLVPGGFVHFHLNAMRAGPGVLADSGDLPRNLDAWLIRFDGETAIRHFLRDDSLRELADYRELIAKIRVQRFEPRGHGDDGRTAAIRDRIAVVDVHHVGRFDEGVVEILVSRIERMIDLERAAGFLEIASNTYGALEVAGKGIIPVATLGVDSISIHRLCPGAPISIDGVAPIAAGCARATGGQNANARAARARAAITVLSSIRCDATSPGIKFGSTLTASRVDARPAITGALRRPVAIRRSAVRANSVTPGVVDAGKRLPAVSGDCGMIRRGVGDVEDRVAVAVRASQNGNVIVPAGPCGPVAPVSPTGP